MKLNLDQNQSRMDSSSNGLASRPVPSIASQRSYLEEEFPNLIHQSQRVRDLMRMKKNQLANIFQKIDKTQQEHEFQKELSKKGFFGSSQKKIEPILDGNSAKEISIEYSKSTSGIHKDFPSLKGPYENQEEQKEAFNPQRSFNEQVLKFNKGGAMDEVYEDKSLLMNSDKSQLFHKDSKSFVFSIDTFQNRIVLNKKLAEKQQLREPSFGNLIIEEQSLIQSDGSKERDQPLNDTSFNKDQKRNVLGIKECENY